MPTKGCMDLWSLDLTKPILAQSRHGCWTVWPLEDRLRRRLGLAHPPRAAPDREHPGRH